MSAHSQTPHLPSGQQVTGGSAGRARAVHVHPPRKEWYSHEDRGRRRKRLVLDPLLIDFLIFLNFKIFFSLYTYTMKIEF